MSVVKKIATIKKSKKITTKKVKTVSRKSSVKKKEPVKKKKAPKRAVIQVRVIGGGIKPKKREELAEELAEEVEDEVEEVLEEVLGGENEVKKSGIKKFNILVNLGKKFKKKSPSKEKEKKINKEEKVKPKSIGLYRRISFFFVFLTVILLVLVFYFSFVSLTIYISPEKERISDKLIVTIYNSGDKNADFSSREYIEGVVEQIPMREEKIYEATGAEVIGQKIIGKVTIINNYNQNQALIATTRLLSTDEKLFRIKNDVNVPAGGEVEVEIYADEPSEDMAIAPTEFIIPGLWAGLQDKIYAKSNDIFLYKTEIKKFVQQSDIDKGIQNLKSILIKKAKDNFGSGYKGYDKIIHSLDRNSAEIEIKVKVNDEKGEFKIGISGLINIVGIKKAVVEKIAEEKLISVIPNNKKLIEFNSDKVEYNLGNYNFDVGVATVEAIFSGVMTLKEADSIVNKEKIVGLSEDQLGDYLTNLNKFKDFELVFSPVFIKTAPTLVDKIKIKVKE